MSGYDNHKRHYRRWGFYFIIWANKCGHEGAEINVTIFIQHSFSTFYCWHTHTHTLLFCASIRVSVTHLSTETIFKYRLFETILWYPCSCGLDRSLNKFLNPLRPRLSDNAVDAKARWVNDWWPATNRPPHEI